MAVQNCKYPEVNEEGGTVRKSQSIHSLSDESKVTIDDQHIKGVNSELELEGQEKQTVSSTVLEISNGSNSVLDLNEPLHIKNSLPVPPKEVMPSEKKEKNVKKKKEKSKHI